LRDIFPPKIIELQHSAKRGRLATKFLRLFVRQQKRLERFDIWWSEMPHFYGVYLENTELSTALDLIRFLGEPDSIRFSHVTLRGPYKVRLPKIWLQRVNAKVCYDWKVSLIEPYRFFFGEQNTVVIKINLGSLKGLFHKPAFPDGVPHLTLYDGNDRRLADGIYRTLLSYDWRQEVNVTRLREIGRKEKIDEIFHSCFIAFNKLYQELVGNPDELALARKMSPDRRIELIYSVLGKFRREELARAQTALRIARDTYYIRNAS
jgi:hypothetical protein